MSFGVETVRKYFPRFENREIERDGALTWPGRNLAKLIELRVALSPTVRECLYGDKKMDRTLWKILARVDLRDCSSAAEAVARINLTLSGTDINTSTSYFFPDRFFLRPNSQSSPGFVHELDCDVLPVFLV